jgi:hypothetical protein
MDYHIGKWFLSRSAQIKCALVVTTLLTVRSHQLVAQASDSSQEGPQTRAESKPGPTPAPSTSKVKDPLAETPMLPKSPITLIGGMVTEVDKVSDRLVVRPFAGKQRMRIDFDARTHIFREGKPATERDLKTGERVYLDTMLDGATLFAKNIWIRKGEGSGNSRGQIVNYDGSTNTLTLRDEVSAEPVDFRLDPSTVILKGKATGAISDLRSGSLVAVTFDSQQGRSGVVRQVSLLAQPGSLFTFLGKVTFIDLSERVMAINNQSDDKNYQIYFDALPPSVLQGLREGSEAAVSAQFDGSRYIAQKVDLIATKVIESK